MHPMFAQLYLEPDASEDERDERRRAEALLAGEKRLLEMIAKGEPLATILSQAYVADEFAYLARTPAKAGKEALAKAGKQIGDVERVELNEAFSSVVLNSAKMLDADPETVNVNGGAVALGHPIGASGGRILSTMIYELRRNGGGLGLAAICSGGGQGDALLLEV